MDNILVTGASGFIGSFVVEEALRRGFDTWAGIRAGSSKAYLQDARIHFIDLSYARPDELVQQLRDFKAQHGALGYVVHCAGVTKSADPEAFDRVNHLQTRTLVEALRQADMVPQLFVFLSSLSVCGPLHEDDYAPITLHDEPRPNTAYGRSKLAAENYLRQQADVPTLILRPTGVYGPRERDYFLMAKSISRHVDFSVGYKRQDITFVYVRDVVQAIFNGIELKRQGTYFLTDGQVYQSRTFSDLLIREMGTRHVCRIKSPLWVLRGVSYVAEQWGRATHSATTLNTDKYHIMKQRNWRCDIADTVNDLNYKPAYDLARGVQETVAWYKQEKWI